MDTTTRMDYNSLPETPSSFEWTRRETTSQPIVLTGPDPKKEDDPPFVSYGNEKQKGTQSLVKRKRNVGRSQDGTNRERNKGPKYEHESSLLVTFCPDMMYRSGL